MRPEDLGFGRGARTETRAEDRVGCDVCGRGPCLNQCGLELGGPYEGRLVTPDQEPRTGGVAVWRCPRHGFPTEYTDDASQAREYGDEEPGTWFPIAEAEALIDAKRDLEREVEMHGETIAERDALIDPNDPAVRERISVVLRTIVAGTWSDVSERSQFADEMADAVLAALRGAK